MENRTKPSGGGGGYSSIVAVAESPKILTYGHNII